MTQDTKRANRREEVLKQALLIHDEKAEEHGHYNTQFQTCSRFWTEYLRGRKEHKHSPDTITAFDVAMMMTLMKISRISHGNREEKDHYIDGANYLAIAFDIINAPIAYTPNPS